MSRQDDQYRAAVQEYGAALDRLARAYEARPEDCRDLVQEIHLALWRSFESFDGRCSVRTWVYRVAHNAAASHILRSRRAKQNRLISLEEMGESGEPEAVAEGARSMESNHMLRQLYTYIHRLNPIDRQIMLLYLEGMDAASIGEVAGISPSYTATKIHRIKRLLAERFRNGGDHDKQ